MDIQRPSAARKRRLRRAIYVFLGLAAIVGITVGLSRLEPAAPTVERATVWLGKVERGSMIRQVRGSGTLVPEEFRWVPAETSGRVEQIFVQPGAVVTSQTAILELSSPELEQEVLDAGSQIKISQAQFANLQVQRESDYMNLQAEAARIESEYLQAQLQAQAEEELGKDGLVSDITVKISRARSESLATRNKLDKERLAIFSKATEAQLEAKQAEIEQRKVLYQLRLRQIESLNVRSGISGVLQQVLVEVGQQVAPGTNLARVAEPDRLKAEVRVAATQARDIQFGQKASIDTRNGVIPRVVSRIDPAVQEALVTVDVKLMAELPRGARPDLNVDGTIELEHMEDVLFMPRPVFGQENATIGLFKLEADGTHATRVQVKLGRSSVSQIEILDGLHVGDEVVLSDMSQSDTHDRVLLN